MKFSWLTYYFLTVFMFIYCRTNKLRLSFSQQNRQILTGVLLLTCTVTVKILKHNWNHSVEFVAMMQLPSNISDVLKDVNSCTCRIFVNLNVC